MLLHKRGENIELTWRPVPLAYQLIYGVEPAAARSKCQLYCAQQVSMVSESGSANRVAPPGLAAQGVAQPFLFRIVN